MLHVALLFERAQDGQHGGVSQLVGELVLHLVDHGWTVVPEHAHHVGFAVGQQYIH